MRIAYVVARWGEPTETFVRREVDAGIEAGHAVTILSLKPPALGAPAGASLVHLTRARVVAGGLAACARRPVAGARAAGRCVRGTTLRTILPQLYATLFGLAAGRACPPVDWIHAHFAWVAATAADALAEARSARFSVMAHAFDIFDERVVDPLLTAKLRRAAFVVVESPAIAGYVEERFGCAATVLRMGVPPAYVVAQAPARPGRRVLSVGKLRAKKGHDHLIRAMRRVTPPWELIIVGEGPERPHLETVIGESPGDVRLLGHLGEDEVRAELDRATVFCLASRVTEEGDRDGVPNVLIEAMARGVPVVSTAVAGIPDLLADGRGVVVEPGDETALAAALEEALGDDALRARLAAAALDHVRSDYTTTANWAVLERLIDAHR